MLYQTLPTPDHLYTSWGIEHVSGLPGPGYANITLSSNSTILKNSVNSGRTEVAIGARHFWELSISYNKMPRDVFDVIYSFLLSKADKLEPFWVSLPQTQGQITTDFFHDTQSQEKDSIYTTYFVATATKPEGDPIAPSSIPKVGDLFIWDYINATSGGSYKGMYQVTRVETPERYNFNKPILTNGVTSYEARIHFWPPNPYLNTLENTPFSFDYLNVKILSKPSTEIKYSLDSQNLYSIDFKATEVFPNG